MTELAEALNKHTWFTGFDIVDEPPVKYSLKQWIEYAKEAQAVVFIAGSSRMIPHSVNLCFMIGFIFIFYNFG